MTTLKRYNGSSWETVGLPTNVGMSPQTLAYAEATANQASITTLTDVTGLNVTFTVPAGRRIRIVARTFPSSSVSGDEIDTYIRNPALGDVSQYSRVRIGAGGAAVSSTAEVVLTPAAGTHTFKVTMARISGTGTVTNLAHTSYPSFILVEDITGSTLPYQPASVPVGQLAYAQRTTNMGSITTDVAVPELTVNVVVPAGRTLRLTASAFMKGTTVNTTSIMRIREGSTILNMAQMPNVPANIGNRITAIAVVSPSAGAHTYHVTVEDFGGGTGQLDADPVYPAFLLVEDITATPAPASTAPSSTLAYAQITSPAAAVSTETAIPGLSVTITVPAGRRIRISGHAQINNDATTGVVLGRIFEGAAEIGRWVLDDIQANGWTMGDGTTILSPSAGTHTYHLAMWKFGGAGTVYVNANPAWPAYILVEDITGSGISGHTHTEFDAWTAWTPTVGNLTIGNGTLTGRYIKVGRTVHYYLKIIFGSTSAVTGAVNFAPPVTPAQATDNVDLPGTVTFLDFGTASFAGRTVTAAGNIYLHVLLANGTYAQHTNLSGTVPFTWAVNDAIVVSGTYEAAS